jgi:hypothetical protein
MVVWYEAGYVPGYRVCMAAPNDRESLTHRFIAGGSGHRATLIRV